MESISKSLISQALLSEISCKQDFYVIRGFSPSAEGLTAYHSHVVPCFILSKGLPCGKDILYLYYCAKII